MRFDNASTVVYYCLIQEEFGRKGTNSGWLISHLEKANDEKKKECINKIFNRK